jgi:uncharacterized paraquat-inducible protein A
MRYAAAKDAGLCPRCERRVKIPPLRHGKAGVYCARCRERARRWMEKTKVDRLLRAVRRLALLILIPSSLLIAGGLLS